MFVSKKESYLLDVMKRSILIKLENIPKVDFEKQPDLGFNLSSKQKIILALAYISNYDDDIYLLEEMDGMSINTSIIHLVKDFGIVMSVKVMPRKFTLCYYIKRGLAKIPSFEFVSNEIIDIINILKQHLTRSCGILCPSECVNVPQSKALLELSQRYENRILKAYKRFLRLPGNMRFRQI